MVINPQDNTKNILKTLPKLQSLKNRNNLMNIGIPKETMKDEKRVALTPKDVESIVRLGYEVFIEHGAGEKANIQDIEYSESGAKLVKDTEIIYKNCDIIGKIAPLTLDEINMLGTNKIIFSALNISTQKKEAIANLSKKKCTAIAYELFENQNNFNPFTHAIGEITGTSAVMIASELLSSTSGGRGILLGSLSGFPPAEIIILGTDISAEYAIRIAIGLGAIVKVFDNSIQNLIKIHKIFGQNLYTSTINEANLKHELANADVLINTIAIEEGQKFIITEDMIRLMKKGSVIIDLKVDQGSIIETSEITSFENPTYKKNDVIHYCVPNLASRVAYTSSIAISNLLTTTLIKILEQGSIIPFLQYNSDIRKGTYLFKGVVTNKIVAERFNFDYTDINFIIHVF